MKRSVDKLKKEKIVLRPSLLFEVDEFCKKIGEEIKSLRRKRGLSQGELARKLRISQQMISRVESGRQNISLLTLKKIASSLGAKVQIKLA